MNKFYSFFTACSLFFSFLKNKGKYRLAAAAVLLLLCSIGNNAFGFGTTYYDPSGATASGGGTYCTGTVLPGLTGSISEATNVTLFGAATSSTVQWYWYYNTTGAASTLAGATLVYTGTPYTADAGPTDPANLPGASMATAPGTYYYFLYVTGSGGTSGFVGPFYSGLRTVIINSGVGIISGTSVICQGATTTLTETVGGGAWTSSTLAVATVNPLSGLVGGISGGTSIISYTLGGCSATKIVTVIAAPPAITGLDAACVGSTTNLTDASLPGAWSSVSPLVASVSGTGVVSGLSAGTSTISYTLASTGCSTGVVVTVNPLPGAISGTTSVCVGLTTSLSDGGAGAWSSSNANTSVSPTGVVTGLTAGTSVITYTAGAGCFVTTVVTVNPLPLAINGTTNICAGLSYTLTDLTGGGTWASSNIPVANIGSSSGILTGAASGTTNITFMLPTGCIASTVVTVNPAPGAISGTATVCEGLTTTLSDGLAGGLWNSSNANATIGSVTGIVTGVTAGTSTISYTTPTCNPVMVVVTVNPSPAAISGSLTVCSGLTSSFSDAVIGGSWVSSNPGVATIGSSSGLVSALSAGTTNITYTLPAGCNTVVVLTVLQSPGSISGTTVACQGLSSTLSDTPIGGTWTSSNGNTSIVPATGVATGMSSGTSTITYTLPDACIATATFTVNPLPAGITGLASGCTGLSINLSDATAGGAWSSGNPVVASVGALTGVVSGLSVGTAMITYQLPTTCIATIEVTVNPSPLAIVGSTTVCVGSNTTLTDPAIGGTWASSAPLTAGIGSLSGIVTGFAAGVTTITYTLPIGGCTATMDMTVNPLPLAISGVTSVCAGSTVTLSNSTAGGTWSSSNPAVATISATGTVDGVTAGVVTITYMLGTGCYVTSPMTVNPLPVAITGTGYVCAGLTTTVSDLTPGGAWSSNLPATASIVAGSGVITGVAPGVATISYTLPTTCYITTAVTVNAPPTAISGPNTVCLSSAINLINGTAGGAWTTTGGSGSVSVSSSTGVVTGLAVGTATIYYTTFSCNPVSYSISVNPLPAPITGMGSVCSGSSVTLSDITPGGVWSSGSASATVSSTGVVSGVTAGTVVNISYTLPTTCFVSVPIDIDSIPAAILGADSVCPGSSVVLSDVTAGGVWTSSDGTIALSVATTGVVTGMVAGNVLISYTLISGCSISKPFHVETPVPSFLSIKATPGDSLLCSNTPDTLTAVDSNGGTPTFVWKIFGAYVGSGPTYSYNPLHADFITCTMTTNNICASPSVISADITLNVWPEAAPIIDITTAQPDTSSYLGQVYTFYSTTTFGGPSPSYQWYINNAPIGGATSAVFTTSIYNDNDTIYCVVNSNSPCDTSLTTRGSNSLIIYGQGYLSVGGVTASGNDLSLFPNPNNGSFMLSGKVNTNNNKEITIEMSDMLGRTVYVVKTTPDTGQVRADIKLDADVAPGTYLLRVHTETGTETFHFVVSK